MSKPRFFEITDKIVLGFIFEDEQRDVLLDEGKLELRDGTVHYLHKDGKCYSSTTTPNIIDISLKFGRIRETT